MKTYLLTLGYDGTNFHGWQRQPQVRTVQQEVEDALCKLVGSPVAVTASGRTDEGVHALGQAVSFECDTSIPANKIADALNSRLPCDIRAINCVEAEQGFCARKSAKRKTYCYKIYTGEFNCALDRYALKVDCNINLPLMRQAAKLICGSHDFRSFYCLGSAATTTVRTVYDCSFDFYKGSATVPDYYEFKICGNGFLYKMVRLLTGALLSLNCGKITLNDFAAALDGNPSVRKVPALGKGLTLVSVEYDL